MENKRSRSLLFLFILVCLSLTVLAESSGGPLDGGGLACFDPDCQVSCDCNYCVCSGSQSECAEACEACWEYEPWWPQQCLSIK